MGSVVNFILSIDLKRWMLSVNVSVSEMLGLTNMKYVVCVSVWKIKRNCDFAEKDLSKTFQSCILTFLFSQLYFQNTDKESLEKLGNGISNKEQTITKRSTSLKRKKCVTKQKSTGQVKPCFPAKKRVHVTPFAASETPVRPKKVLKLGETDNNLTDSKERDADKLTTNLQKSPSLRPFFWLREEEEIENFVSLSSTSPLKAPCFSDLKDSQDEVPSNTTPDVSIRNLKLIFISLLMIDMLLIFNAWQVLELI
jgi:hypothetical protein